MFESPKRKPIDSWRGIEVPHGQRTNVFLPVSESYTGLSLKIPIQIQRGLRDGPVVFITAALHGDELNGTGAIRDLVWDEDLKLQRGALILVPILNLLAFDRHSRYLPDRRDLNRFFPGSSSGSQTGRIAQQIFCEIVATAVRGIKNILRTLEMIEGKINRPEKQVVIEKAKWVRADRGGFLQFHVRPGQLVTKGQPLATNTSLLGQEKNVLTAPFDGVILGMTTLPAVSPGEPVCHVGRLLTETHAQHLHGNRAEAESLERKTVKDLASNVLIIERENQSDSPP